MLCIGVGIEACLLALAGRVARPREVFRLLVNQVLLTYTL